MTASFADHEIWHVLLASDDMKRMDVEQLDDAFRLSLVDASTLVWKAGMKTWQRLGAVAGLDDEPVAVTRRAPPAPPAPPPPRPAPRALSAASAPFGASAATAFAAPLFVAPVYSPALHAPDPYLSAKRQVSLPSEVDFRRRPGGIRFGRWLFGFLLLIGSVLVSYHQNWLREGARKLGIEGKYLASERRLTAFVTAKASPQTKNVLTRLALLPGPNALPAATPTKAASAAVVTRPPAETAKPSSSPPSGDAELRTVSLDSLPVLTADPTAAAPPVVQAPRPKAKATAQVESKTLTKPAKTTPKIESPKLAPQAAPPPANESFLKAAIRSAIVADGAKKK